MMKMTVMTISVVGRVRLSVVDSSPSTRSIDHTYSSGEGMFTLGGEEIDLILLFLLVNGGG